MIDIVLLAGRITLVALLYLFLIFAIKTGLGQIRGKSRGGRNGADAPVRLTVIEGPAALIGTSIPVISTLVIGRAPSSDIVVSDDFISGSHARITPVPDGAVLEDLGSTNGTVLNGTTVQSPQALRPGDRIQTGTLVMVVDAR